MCLRETESVTLKKDEMLFSESSKKASTVRRKSQTKTRISNDTYGLLNEGVIKCKPVSYDHSIESKGE
jgi:hypothetical protein